MDKDEKASSSTNEDEKLSSSTDEDEEEIKREIYELENEIILAYFRYIDPMQRLIAISNKYPNLKDYTDDAFYTIQEEKKKWKNHK